MTCEVTTLPGGGTVISCTRWRIGKTCVACGRFGPDRLCDGSVGNTTRSAPLHRRCARVFLIAGGRRCLCPACAASRLAIPSQPKKGGDAA
jgi:hypothetical protein